MKFEQNDFVIYIPNHAKNDPGHKDCEQGIVSSVRNGFVFVTYVRTDMLQQTSEATLRKNLVHQSNQFELLQIRKMLEDMGYTL